MKKNYFKLLLILFISLFSFTGCSYNKATYVKDSFKITSKESSYLNLELKVNIEKGYVKSINYTIYGEATINSNSKFFSYKSSEDVYLSSKDDNQKINLNFIDYEDLFGSDYSYGNSVTIHSIKIKNIKFNFRKDPVKYTNTYIGLGIGVLGIGALVTGCLIDRKKENA